MTWINLNRLAPARLKPFVVTGIAVLSLCSVLWNVLWNEKGTAFAQSEQTAADASYPELSDEQVAWIGNRIFANECNRQRACLTSWNAGEDFPSMGIGHFIWFQQGQDSMFQESFPALLRYLQENGVVLPEWVVAENFESPWQSREGFLNDMDGDRLQELRDLLARSMDEQTAFIISRFESALDTILTNTDSPDQAAQLKYNFYRVASSSPPYGLYALIDYVNFKGTGVSAQETYSGEGWGLKQVLLGMNNSDAPLADFATSARHALNTRVANAPAQRNETRWLNGWNNRLDTYLPPELTAAP